MILKLKKRKKVRTVEEVNQALKSELLMLKKKEA
jgi:hypothetical protein